MSQNGSDFHPKASRSLFFFFFFFLSVSSYLDSLDGFPFDMKITAVYTAALVCQGQIKSAFVTVFVLTKKTYWMDFKT